MSSPWGLLALTFVATFTFVAGAALYVSSSRRSRLMVDAVTSADTMAVSLRMRWDSTFRRTAMGRWLASQLALAGIERRPLDVLVVVVGVTLVIVVALWKLLAPGIGVLSLGLGYVLLRGFLVRARDRRREAFVAQLPEIARIMSNATSAGLSMQTALAVTAAEIAEPARSELSRVTDALKFGRAMEPALRDMADRLPSRETRVLVSTLVVSSRAGGSLIHALRDISDTLEDRKEVRREIRTTLAQSVATGYFVVAMGIGILFLLNVISPGSVHKMTTSIVGQLALAFNFGMFALGLFLIRRMTRIEP
jgi:tight adherence protein B